MGSRKLMVLMVFFLYNDVYIGLLLIKLYCFFCLCWFALSCKLLKHHQRIWNIQWFLCLSKNGYSSLCSMCHMHTSANIPNVGVSIVNPLFLFIKLDTLFCKYFRFILLDIILLMFHIHGLQNLKCAIVWPVSIWSHLSSQLMLQFWHDSKVRKFSCVFTTNHGLCRKAETQFCAEAYDLFYSRSRRLMVDSANSWRVLLIGSNNNTWNSPTPGPTAIIWSSWYKLWWWLGKSSYKKKARS